MQNKLTENIDLVINYLEELLDFNLKEIKTYTNIFFGDEDYAYNVSTVKKNIYERKIIKEIINLIKLKFELIDNINIKNNEISFVIIYLEEIIENDLKNIENFLGDNYKNLMDQIIIKRNIVKSIINYINKNLI